MREGENQLEFLNVTHEILEFWLKNIVGRGTASGHLETY